MQERQRLLSSSETEGADGGAEAVLCHAVDSDYDCCVTTENDKDIPNAEVNADEI